MAALNLTLEGVEVNKHLGCLSRKKQPSFTLDKVLKLMQDFLQPDSTLEVSKVGHYLLAMVPEKGNRQELFELGEAYIELAEQIPYHHPSQLKLARLVELTSRSSRVRNSWITVSGV